MNAVEIYKDVSFRINKQTNGELTYTQFNATSWLAQLNLIDWLTGSMTGQQPPEPYLTQKNRDWLSFLITKKDFNVVGGSITRPEDYYQYENFYKIGGNTGGECDEDKEEDEDEVVEESCSTPIRLMSNEKFNQRCQTYIKSLKPSFKKPIAKQVGVTFELKPADIGSVTLEYIRYPKRAEIKTKMDTTYNEEVPDEATTVNFEWPEYARPLLIWFVVDEFFNNTREQAGKQFNSATGKTPRG